MEMKVAVIGAGTMGSGIAQAFAQCDAVEKVYLCDIKQEFADGGKAKIKKTAGQESCQGQDGAGCCRQDPWKDPDRTERIAVIQTSLLRLLLRTWI
jgi:3-hydroxyacyl-CoA dehydrogenase